MRRMFDILKTQFETFVDYFFDQIKILNRVIMGFYDNLIKSVLCTVDNYSACTIYWCQASQISFL